MTLPSLALPGRVLAGACAVALVARLGGIGMTWLPPARLLVLALVLIHAADLWWRNRARLDPRRVVREHWFGIGVAVLILLTCAVRLPGLNGELGHVPIDIDENRLAASVQHFFVTGELQHTTVEHHPGFAFWLFAAAAFVSFLRGLGDGVVTTPAHLNVGVFVAAARYTNVLVATGIVASTAYIGRRIAGPWAGLFAGALVAVAPLSVDTTTACRCDAVMLLAVVVAVQLALICAERKTSWWFVAAGAVAGIAAGVKYSGAFAIVPVLLALLTLDARRQRLAAAIAAILACLGAVAITNHFIWSDFPNFLLQLTAQIAITGRGHWAATSNPAGFYVEILTRFGPGAGLLVAAGIFVVYALSTRRLDWWIVISFPLLYIGFMTQRPSQLPRWVYPMVPFVAIGSAAALALVIARVRQAMTGRPRAQSRALAAATVALVAALVVQPIWSAAVALSHRLAVPTYTLAEHWIREHAAPGAVVLSGNGWLDLNGSGLVVRRVDDLGKALDGGLPTMTGSDWVVVPEPYFGHPSLRQLMFVDRIHAEQRFGAGSGSDYEFYAVPRL